MTFKLSNYSDIIKEIKDSRAYVSYIDTKKHTRTINRRYENYVKLKQAAYTVNAPNRNRDPNITKICSTNFMGVNTPFDLESLELSWTLRDIPSVNVDQQLPCIESRSRATNI